MIRIKYKLGDVIRISSDGGCYTTYNDAILFFNITRNVTYNVEHSFRKINIPKDYKDTNWVIVGIALHGNFDSYVYCLENMRGERILSDDNYFILRPNVITNYTKKLKDKNITYKIKKIPIYY